MPTIDEVLERARRRFVRVERRQAAAEHAGGAPLIDIRTETQRAEQGEIRGALIIDRTVMEWRLDPTSSSKIAQASDHERRLILICHEGYSSSVAAASLHDLGLVNATDVIGGVQACKVAGLPVEPSSPRPPFPRRSGSRRGPGS